MSIESYIGMLYLEPYMDKSTELISKRDLMKLCIDRVKAYQKVNQLYAQMDDGEGLGNNSSKAEKIYNEYNCLDQRNDEFWIKDNAAHFFLEIVYSESDEKILEFLKYQLQLFKTRFAYINDDENNFRLIKMCQKLLGDNQIEQVTKQEWEESNLIRNGTGKPLMRVFNQKPIYKQFYKIPYYNVLHSVSQLHTYLKNGIAYIYVDELKKCINDVFITRMKRRMQNYQNNLQFEKLKSNDEYRQMFQKILATDSGELTQKFTGIQQDSLNCATVKQQSLDLFPLCMEYLIDRLEVNHHLKHNGRQQIQLFFKSAGMKMIETIKYMKIQFSPRVNEADFDKSYSYNIRHNYGQEGKRENYQCYSCSYNLKQTPGNDEFHGCPLKTLNNETLEKYLKNKKKYETTDIEQILNLKKDNHFQLACTYMWKVKCKGSDNNIIIDNPIVFYREALEHQKKISLKFEQEK